MSQKTEKAKRALGTGSLYQQPGTDRWTISYYSNGKRVREAANTTSRQRAQELLSTRLASVAKGEPLDLCRPQRVQELYAHLKKQNDLNGKPTDTARWRLHLEPAFATVLASRITAPMVLAYRAQRQAAAASVATVNRELALLRHVLRVAYRDNLLVREPRIQLAPENNVRTGFVDDAKLDELRQAAAKVGLWMRTFVELGATYGWRRGEMLGLRCRQVDFAAGVHGVARLETGTTKNRHGREVPLTRAVRLLLEQCCTGKRPTDHVLTRGRPPRPVGDVRCAWRNLCIKVGLGQWRCRTPQCDTVQAKRKRCPKCKRRDWEYLGLLVHDLRRTGVRNLRRAGVAEEVAMTISGHRTSSTFRRYDIVCNEDKVVALEKLERAQQRSRTARAAQLARKAEASHNTDITGQPSTARVQ